MKTIFAVTGTRADYGIQRPVYDAIRRSGKFRLKLVVTGMHLDVRFGSTVKEIRRDGFAIAAMVRTLPKEDTKLAMAKYVGATMMELATVFAKQKPDLVLVLGDRGEMLAAAFAAAELGIPLAHLHGGESSGTIDDLFRHAITQLSNIHLTSTDEHSERVQAMKEDAEHIFTVGAPALDVINTLKPVSRKNLLRRAKFDPNMPVVLFVQHPDTLSELTPAQQIGASITALRQYKGNLLIVGSNADAGGQLFNATLKNFAQKRKNTRFVMSMPHGEFLSWLAAADLLMGNSSSGIIEAASFHLPVLNIGNRQRSRLRSGNVLDVSQDAKAIGKSLERILTDEKLRARLKKAKNRYGDGKSSMRIVKILEKTV